MSAAFERRGEVAVDERRRLSLGRLIDGLEPHARFEAWTDDDGRVWLKPIVSVPAVCGWALHP